MKLLVIFGTLLMIASFMQAFAEESQTKPEYLYKVVSQEEWQASLVEKEVVLSPMDKEFIHLATEDQFTSVIQKFWSGRNPLVLKLATNQLVGHLVYEQNPGGNTKYYHLYEGHIPLEAVKGVIPTELK